MQGMEVAAQYTVMTTQRGAGNGSPTDGLRARNYSTRGRIIDIKEIDEVERRTRSITITESEYMTSDAGSDKQGRDVHHHNVSIMHNYSVGPTDNARLTRALYDEFKVPEEVECHEDKTAEWVLYHAFSNNKPELISNPISKQYTQTNGKYICNICAMDSGMPERFFTLETEIKNHLEMIHDMEGDYVCKLCNKFYVRASDHYNHVQDAHYIKLEPLDDDISKESLLLDHTTTMPSTSSHVEVYAKEEVSEKSSLKREKMRR